MPDITFKRTSVPDANDQPVFGQLTIGDKTWPTVERGRNYTFVRKGTYKLYMTTKSSGRAVKCMAFMDPQLRKDGAGKSVSRAISTHLIHDALNDKHTTLSGCIAPGLSADANGIKDSEKAMKEVFLALGGWTDGTWKTIEVENNIHGEETGEQWIQRRLAAKQAKEKANR